MERKEEGADGVKRGMDKSEKGKDLEAVAAGFHVVNRCCLFSFRVIYKGCVCMSCQDCCSGRRRMRNEISLGEYR